MLAMVWSGWSVIFAGVVWSGQSDLIIKLEYCKLEMTGILQVILLIVIVS